MVQLTFSSPLIRSGLFICFHNSVCLVCCTALSERSNVRTVSVQWIKTGVDGSTNVLTWHSVGVLRKTKKVVQD
jgi:hypothetical protein